MNTDFRFPDWEESRILQLLDFANATVEERYDWLVQTYLLLEPYLQDPKATEELMPRGS